MIEDILTDSIIAELDVVIRHLEIMSLKKILEIDKYVNIVNENLNYIFESGFSKHTCMYYQQKTIKHYCSYLATML